MRRGVLDTVGSPLVQVNSPPGSVLAAKMESSNPGGSAKVRPAIAMIEAAEQAGALRPGDRIVEPTSGNTGIGIAMIAAAKGYEATIVMPESKSPERRAIMRAYGARVELVSGSISVAKDRADELEQAAGTVQLRQFENAANPEAHFRTTAEEILDQVDGHRIDALVCGVGTGGTITGVGRRLQDTYPDCRLVAVEPETNAVLSGAAPGEDDYQGMGAGFIPENLDVALLDAVETVSVEAAEAECRRLAHEEGILVGQSSGASNLAARRVAEELADPAAGCPQPSNETALLAERDDIDRSIPESCPLVVTVYWDSGERYMSTGMFDEP